AGAFRPVGSDPKSGGPSMNKLFVFAVVVAASGVAQAQAPPTTTPSPSEPRRQEARARAPRETVAAALNGRKVSIEYGRPALDGRAIDTLLSKLSADRIWRA